MRISGPLLDRIDLHAEVPALAYRELASPAAGESSGAVAARVEMACEIQADRYGPADGNGAGQVASARLAPTLTNARASMRALKATLRLDAVAEKILERSMEKLGLSARGHDRILRVARTIADLEGSDRVRSIHVAEAVQYRYLDRPVGEMTAGR
jgi:magnesium chelatase family protein